MVGMIQVVNYILFYQKNETIDANVNKPKKYKYSLFFEFIFFVIRS
jgi:hypothetical protein